MADRVYFCPDCRTPNAESQLATCGRFLQCPKCKLHFTTAHLNSTGAIAARKNDNDWSSYGLAVKGAAPDQSMSRGAYRSPFGPLGRRRHRPLRVAVYFLIWGSAAVLLAIAGIMMLIVRPTRTEPLRNPVVRNKPATPARKAEPPSIVAGAPTPTIAANLSGHWDALDEPLENPAGGEIVAL